MEPQFLPLFSGSRAFQENNVSSIYFEIWKTIVSSQILVCKPMTTVSMVVRAEKWWWRWWRVPCVLKALFLCAPRDDGFCPLRYKVNFKLSGSWSPAWRPKCCSNFWQQNDYTLIKINILNIVHTPISKRLSPHLKFMKKWLVQGKTIRWAMPLSNPLDFSNWSFQPCIC